MLRYTRAYFDEGNDFFFAVPRWLASDAGSGDGSQTVERRLNLGGVDVTPARMINSFCRPTTSSAPSLSHRPRSPLTIQPGRAVAAV